MFTEEKKDKAPIVDKPCGQFAHLGGIERLPAHSIETPEKEISFEHLGGKCVRKPMQVTDRKTTHSMIKARKG